MKNYLAVLLGTVALAFASSSSAFLLDVGNPPPIEKNSLCGCVHKISSTFINDQKRIYHFELQATNSDGLGGLSHLNVSNGTFHQFTFGKYNIKYGSQNYPLTDDEIKAHAYELEQLYFAANMNRLFCVTLFTSGHHNNKAKRVQVFMYNCQKD